MFKLRVSTKDDADDGVWFSYPGTDLKLQIRQVRLGKAMELRSKVTKKVAVPIQDPVPGSPPFVIDSTPNDSDLSWVVFDYMLQDWQGMEATTASGIAPTVEDIKRAIYDNDGLRKFVTDKSNELSEVSKKAEEVKEKIDSKNVPSSQNG